MILYLLIINYFSYGFQFDHIEAFKTSKLCINRAHNLPKGKYPDFIYINGEAFANCMKINVVK